MSEQTALTVVPKEEREEHFLFPEITSPRKRAYLTAYAECGGIIMAGQLANVHHRNHYFWIRDDAVYARAFEKAQSMAADAAEDEVTRRGVHGVTEPVYYKGSVVGHVQKYSDVLLMFKLNGERGEKFKRLPASAPNPDSTDAFQFQVELQPGGDKVEGSNGKVEHDEFSFAIGNGEDHAED